MGLAARRGDRPSEGIEVVELERREFERLQPEWDSLCLRSVADPFTRQAFLLTYLDAFEPRARLVVLAARSGGRLLGGLPLVRERARMLGIPIDRLRAPVNAHSCRFDLIAHEACRQDVAAAIWRHLLRGHGGGFDVLLLEAVPCEGEARRLVTLAQGSGHPVAERLAWQTPYLPLAGGFEAVQAGLSPKFRSNLRRRRRRLEERGRVSVRLAAPRAAELPRRLEAGLALEASGWKGRAGSAILCDPRVQAFYERVARSFAHTGELQLYFLTLDGRPVAFFFCLAAGGRLSLPKLAYDESFADCSPGHLLMEEVLRDACARRFSELDFLGPSMPWKLSWTRRVRPHHSLWIFGRNPRARALHRVRFRLMPAARRALRALCLRHTEAGDG